MDCIEQLYLEHEQMITDNLPEIKHVDLWAEQVNFLEDEHPFKSPAVFFAYRSDSMKDMAEKLQEVQLQIDVYYFYETFPDTHRGAKRQLKGIEYLQILSKINALFHGRSGQYFKEMHRVAFAPVETGKANLLYVQRYEAYMIDESARVLSQHVEVNDIEIENKAPEPTETDDTYQIDM